MPLRGTSTPYPLSTQRFQRARLLLRLSYPAQAFCGILTARFAQARLSLSLPAFGDALIQNAAP
jgi:hypothetical protein